MIEPPHSELKNYAFDFAKRRLRAGVDLVCAGAGVLGAGGRDCFQLPLVQDGVVLLYMPFGEALLEPDELRLPMVAPAAVVLCDRGGVRLRPGGQNQPCHFYYAGLSGKSATGMANEFHQSAFVPFEPGNGAEMTERFEKLLDDARRGLLADAFQGAQHGFGLLMEFCRALEAEPAHTHPELVHAAMALIEEQYPYLFGVEDVAEALGVSKHHLIRQFTRAVGTSPGKYLAGTRIHHAKLLLKDPEYGVGIVGQLVGYANGNYFGKVFRLHTGMSPGEFRNRFVREG